MARTRRSRADQDVTLASRDASRSLLARHELRYILIEILIVATGVFIALLVEELRQRFERRTLVAETRRAVSDEAELNLSRIARKLTLMHNAALILDKDPARAPALVEAQANEEPQPLEAAWTLATQGDVLRALPADESRRISIAYTAQSIFVSVMREEMDAWTRLSRTEGPGASPADTAQRGQAIREWRAYAQRVAVSGCVEIVRVERVLDTNVPIHAGRICLRYRLEQDPAVIFRALKRPLPNLQTL